jgi:hypothetical protein
MAVVIADDFERVAVEYCSYAACGTIRDEALVW